MKIKNIAIIAAQGLALTSLVACESTKEEINDFNLEEVKEEFLAEANEVVIGENTVTFKDDSGRDEVTLDKNVSNVMNLYSSFTTLWYEAGGVANYVIGGSSATELYEEYIGRDITKDEGVEVVATSASGSKWSVETMLSNNPGLIICSTSMSGYSTIYQPAESLSIPVIAVSYNDFSDYLKWFKVFSALTGNEELYETVALDSLDKVLKVVEECSTLEGRTVLSLFSGTGAFKINTEYTLVGSMINTLGCTNVSESFYNPTKTERLDINMESIYTANPSMILIQCHNSHDVVSDALNQLYGDNAVWNAIDAVKNDQVFYLEKVLFHNKPNSRFSEAYQILAKLLYPENQFSF